VWSPLWYSSKKAQSCHTCKQHDRLYHKVRMCMSLCSTWHYGPQPSFLSTTISAYWKTISRVKESDTQGVESKSYGKMNVGIAESSISNTYPKFAVHAQKNVCVRQRVDTFSIHKMWNRTYCSDLKKICLWKICALQTACQLALN
jgi:hypothetical protein